MRVVACLVAAVAWVACTFSDPNLSQTQFRCDGGGACPAGQVCKNQTCVVSTHDGVACTTACAPGEQCCDDNFNPPRCIAATAECLGTGVFCDGIEDCAGGAHCCRSGTQQSCTADADASCGLFACQQDEDCPSVEPNCCEDPGGPKPWKVCSTFPC